MRWEFQLGLYDLMKRDERVVLLWGDVGKGLFKRHIEDFGNRVINMGICEQSLVSVASGMAMQGLRPICYTITPFLIERAFEQIKIDIDQMNQPVGLVGHSDASSGPTHIELDACKTMSMFNNIISYFPKTKLQARELIASENFENPWFMALKNDPQ